ncbi:hypothetical protein ACH5RR_029379 [Cinchona calisaya]|uniref:Uncharacterized protein n=1 Tax=Cinchona calisaya TaxID=153742 RepID=A0ABD2YSN7_9GENT
MDALRVVLDALSFLSLLRVPSVPPDFKTPVGKFPNFPNLTLWIHLFALAQKVTKRMSLLKRKQKAIEEIARTRFQTDGEKSFVRKAFYGGLKVISSVFEPILYNRSVFLRTHDPLFAWSSRAFFGCGGSNPIHEHMGNEASQRNLLLGYFVNNLTISYFLPPIHFKEVVEPKMRSPRCP